MSRLDYNSFPEEIIIEIKIDENGISQVVQEAIFETTIKNLNVNNNNSLGPGSLLENAP